VPWRRNQQPRRARLQSRAAGVRRSRADLIPQVELQRPYRARLKAAGKVVRLVDAPATARTPDFDPAKDSIFELQMVESVRIVCRGGLVTLRLLRLSRSGASAIGIRAPQAGSRVSGRRVELSEQAVWFR